MIGGFARYLRPEEEIAGCATPEVKRLPPPPFADKPV